MTITLRRFALATTAAVAMPGLAAGQIASTPAAGDRIETSLASAIEVARGQIDGGVLEAELEPQGDRLVYEIEIASGESVHEVLVDAQTGQFLSTEEQRLEGAWRGWFDEGLLQGAQAAAGHLTAGLATVEQRFDGRVTEVSLEEEDGQLYYEVEIEAPGGELDAVIDAATGEVRPGELDD